MRYKISEIRKMILDFIQIDYSMRKGSALTAVFFRKTILPVCSLSAVPVFFLLLISNSWWLSIFKSIVIIASIPAGMLITYYISALYVTDSPTGKKKEDYMSRTTFQSVSRILPLLSLFYALEKNELRYIFFLAAAIWFWKILKNYLKYSEDIEENLKQNTFILIYSCSIIFPYMIQRIIYLIFNIPF